MARFTKADIERHTDRGYGTYYPAVNVKVHKLGCTVQDVVDKFGCTEEIAQDALNFAFEAACESFWAYWSDATGGHENGLTGSAEYAYFPGESVMVYSMGRSDGWLVVEGLSPVEEWDAVMLSRWIRFRNDVLADVEHQRSKENLLESIEANQWWKEYSERYNFFSPTDGPDVCLADVKADLIAYSLQKYHMFPATLL
jgi:hypothetical protein